MFSAANSIVLTSSRVFYAMAADRLFFAKLAEVHPRFHTPAFSIIALSAWSILMAISGTFEQLLTYVVFAGWIFYSLAAAALFVFRRRRIGEESPYRVPGYPVFTVPLHTFRLRACCEYFRSTPKRSNHRHRNRLHRRAGLPDLATPVNRNADSKGVKF